MAVQALTGLAGAAVYTGGRAAGRAMKGVAEHTVAASINPFRNFADSLQDTLNEGWTGTTRPMTEDEKVQAESRADEIRRAGESPRGGGTMLTERIRDAAGNVQRRPMTRQGSAPTPQLEGDVYTPPAQLQAANERHANTAQNQRELQNKTARRRRDQSLLTS